MTTEEITESLLKAIPQGTHLYFETICKAIAENYDFGSIWQEGYNTGITNNIPISFKVVLPLPAQPVIMFIQGTFVSSGTVFFLKENIQEETNTYRVIGGGCEKEHGDCTDCTITHYTHWLPIPIIN